MHAFRLFLVFGWAAIAVVTVWAVVDLGLLAAAQTFLSDLQHPWRAQFYFDLELHLFLLGGWIVWREGGSPSGFLAGLATLLLGALFTLTYLLVASIRAGGDVPRVLLGART